MYQDGKFDFKIMLQMKWALLAHPLSYEARRRLLTTTNNVWTKYSNIRPKHYWKFPWIGKKECPDIHKDAYLLAEARQISRHDPNVQHEYPLYRAAGKVYARIMLRSGEMARHEVQWMIDQWVIDEIRWYLDNQSYYFLEQMIERMK